MTRFAECLPLILASEGGYSNNPADNGGPTNLGITQKTLSDWFGRPASIVEVQDLTSVKVAPIYERNYWQAAHCDSLPPGVDYMIFDLAVNSGVGRAARYLQGAAGVAEDGQIGPQTLAAVAGEKPLTLVNKIAVRRELFYRNLHDFPVFGRGWLTRLAAVTAKARTWAS